MRACLLVAALFLTACGPDIYKSADPGKFSGRIFLMWIDDGGTSGDGTFVFVPVPGQELTFVRKDPALPYTVTEVVPEMMYTDGGSIPRLAQVFKGFSPWGYAPAYMVHDWLFIAKNCVRDGMAQGNEGQIADMKFKESAQIMAEAIKTLVDQKIVKPNDVSATLIPSVVGGPVARGLWDIPDTCADRRVTPADRAAAEAGLPGSRKSLRSMTRTLPDKRVIPLQAAKLVGEISF